MNEEESGSDVMLGIPSLETMVDSMAMRKRSKLGGVPIWHGVPPISSIPQCKKCSGEMIFVGQVYAPTTIDRSLYFFCCPSSCASNSNGWLVLRNQGGVHEDEEVKDEEVKSEKVVQKTDWKNICVSNNSNWNINNDDDGDDEDLSDLMDLLNARDNSLNQKISASATPPQPPPTTSTTSSSLVDSSFTNSNPIPSSFGPIWLNEEYESSFSSHGTSNQLHHEEELLRKYLAELTTDNSGEEDSSVLTLLQSRHQTADDMNDDDESDSDEEELRTMLSTRSHVLKNKPEKNNPIVSTQIQRNTKKIELNFQKKLSLCPQQVLRYAYGGVSLLSNPQEKSSRQQSSRCPGCNEKRVFEMELMPTTLTYLCDLSSLKQHKRSHEVSEALPGSSSLSSPLPLPSSSSSSQVTVPPVIDSDGIDFGVVAIWSCPNSCEQSFEELVIVHPPLDTH